MKKNVEDWSQAEEKERERWRENGRKMRRERRIKVESGEATGEGKK
jgi:hypothetical protein